MTHAIDSDDLLFAQVRARHLQSPRQVAAELLAAADDPDRLDGVTPTLARIRAADVLSELGGEQELAEAIEILRSAVGLAIPAELGMAQVALGKTLAEAGDTDGVQELARTLAGDPSWLPGTLVGFLTAISLYGYAGQALNWADEARAAAGRAAGPGGPDPSALQLLERAKQRISVIRQDAEAAGVDPADPAAMRARVRRTPPEAAGAQAQPPWPAGLAGCLVWWPEPAYDRISRQLPDIASVLASPWRGHAARVETALAAAGAGAGLSLVAADFPRFVQFLEVSAADPLAAPTMTAFTRYAGRDAQQVAWPPKGRKPCWCGSGRRYRDCCAAGNG